MKYRMMTAAACLLIAVAASAQGVKISPKMEKGLQHTYRTEVTTNAPGTEVKMGSTLKYVVADVLPDGYELDLIVSDVTSSADANDLMGQMMTLSGQISNGLTQRLKVDQNGRIVGLLNYAEVKQQSLEAAEAFVNRLIEANPEAAQMLPREMLIEQLGGQLTEENLVRTAQETTSVTSLNGRQIATGAQETYTTDQGMKMLRTYFLTRKDGTGVTTSAKLNMSKDELKQMVISQLEKSMPDQVEMIKQNIDMMMGQLTFESTEKATYELDADGWVKTLTTESETDAMGQKVSTKSTITRTE